MKVIIQRLLFVVLLVVQGGTSFAAAGAGGGTPVHRGVFTPVPREYMDRMLAFARSPMFAAGAGAARFPVARVKSDAEIKARVEEVYLACWKRVSESGKTAATLDEAYLKPILFAYLTEDEKRERRVFEAFIPRCNGSSVGEIDLGLKFLKLIRNITLAQRAALLGGISMMGAAVAKKHEMLPVLAESASIKACVGDLSFIRHEHEAWVAQAADKVSYVQCVLYSIYNALCFINQRCGSPDPTLTFTNKARFAAFRACYVPLAQAADPTMDRGLSASISRKGRHVIFDAIVHGTARGDGAVTDARVRDAFKQRVFFARDLLDKTSGISSLELEYAARRDDYHAKQIVENYKHGRISCFVMLFSSGLEREWDFDTTAYAHATAILFERKRDAAHHHSTEIVIADSDNSDPDRNFLKYFHKYILLTSGVGDTVALRVRGLLDKIALVKHVTAHSIDDYAGYYRMHGALVDAAIFADDVRYHLQKTERLIALVNNLNNPLMYASITKDEQAGCAKYAMEGSYGQLALGVLERFGLNTALVGNVTRQFSEIFGHEGGSRQLMSKMVDASDRKIIGRFMLMRELIQSVADHDRSLRKHCARDSGITRETELALRAFVDARFNEVIKPAVAFINGYIMAHVVPLLERLKPAAK